LPTIPYGAVYFRKSNPPKEDWERDYKAAAENGMNAFRHWFLWGAIEIAPGKYDWDDYDRQLDLAAKYGIKTIIAEILDSAPEWAYRQYPHARLEYANGDKASSRHTAACAVGGVPGLCLDNEDVRKRAEEFLRTLVSRYRNHPGHGGYDLWNELHMNGASGGCYCDGSLVKFREWLKAKYKDVRTLGEAWYRYSFATWEDVQMPRQNGPYPDSIDWVLFRIDNAYRLLRWRADLIRSLDADHPVTAHGIPLGCLNRVGPGTYNDWKAGEIVDIHGFSGGDNHQEHSKGRWEHWCQVDVTRSGSRGKPFWSAEMASGASWGNRSGKPLNEGRVVTPSDIRLFNLTSFAGGVTGVFSPRWRPLLDGRHTGNFAFREMDGSPTERSDMAGKMARWANSPASKELWQARPIRGDLGILVIPESQIHCYVSEDNTDFYYDSISGAYRAFLFSNIQADFVYGEHMGSDHEVLYLPYPVMLPEKTVDALKAWVSNGGHLISEGLPAYFGDRGRAGAQQPNYGLDDLFGVKQEDVQFTPDLLEELTFKMEGGYRVRGGVFLQSYKPTTGKVCGRYDDGRVAAVDNTFGKGKTRLIGTFPGYGYTHSQDEETKRFFAEILPWAGNTQNLKSSDPRIIARLHAGDSGATYLWVVNSYREDIPTDLTFSEAWGPFSQGQVFLGETHPTIDGRRIKVTVPARDGLVMELF
jgi:beta-galactosidase